LTPLGGERKELPDIVIEDFSDGAAVTSADTMRTQNIRVERGTKGFGLSLIYRGLDRYTEDEVGVFVAKIVPGGQSQRAGLRENDKILKINNKAPANVNEAVGFIKKAGRNMLLTIERPDATQEQGSLSRAGSVRSFNTAYGGAQSRPQSPGGYSSGYEQGEQEEADRQAQQLAARQASIAEEERRLQAARMEQELQRQRLEAEKLEQQRIYQQQQQQQYQQQQQLLMQQQQRESEARRQAEEEERQRKLQADLDLAAARAGRSRSRRPVSESSDDGDHYPGGHSARSKSLDARRTPRSKSPRAWSGISGLSFGDLPELSRSEEKEGP